MISGEDLIEEISQQAAVRIWGALVEEKQANELMQVLGKHSYMKKLTFENCRSNRQKTGRNVKEEIVISWGKILEAALENPNLSELVIVRCVFSTEDAAIICKAIEKSRCLKTLILDNVLFDPSLDQGPSFSDLDASFKPLSDALIQHPTITKLEIINYQLKDPSIIGEILANSSLLRELKLSCYWINFDNITKMTIPLSKNGNLRVLELKNFGSNSESEYKAIMELGKVLEANTPLQELRIQSDRMIPLKAIKVFANSLRHNTNLCFLQFEGSAIGVAAAVFLSNSLKDNSSVQVLNIEPQIIQLAQREDVLEDIKATLRRNYNKAKKVADKTHETSLGDRKETVESLTAGASNPMPLALDQKSSDEINKTVNLEFPQTLTWLRSNALIADKSPNFSRDVQKSKSSFQKAIELTLTLMSEFPESEIEKHLDLINSLKRTISKFEQNQIESLKL